VWSAKIDSFDGYIFVTAEYNHGIPGALKNAIDYLYKEWNNKAAGFVGYGSAGGVRAVEQLRLGMHVFTYDRFLPFPKGFPCISY
jgi:NAD(P)H-dependent FMN reductase